MAKPKLSQKKRLRLRTEISNMVSQGEKIADIVREMARKYGVAGETIRWYLKEMGVSRRNGRQGMPVRATSGVRTGTVTITDSDGKEEVARLYYVDRNNVVNRLREFVQTL